MFFLQGTIKKLFSLFDDSIKIQLDDEEKSALERSSEKSFLEGITYWTEKTGVYSDCGQLKFQKIVTHSNMIGDFLGNLIDLLNFPGYLSIDFSGTMRNSSIYNGETSDVTISYIGNCFLCTKLFPIYEIVS